MQTILSDSHSKTAAKALRWVIPILLSAALIGTVILLLWSSNKTFGLFDEGFALLGAQSPHDIAASPTFVQNYLAIIWRITGQNIILFRLMGLFITLSAIPIFYVGAKKLFIYLKILSPQKNTLNLLLLFSSISFGILLQYQWLYILPNYDSLIAFALNCCSGFLFLVLASLNQYPIKSRFFLTAFGMGICTGFSLFIKFPTAISLYALIALTLLLFPETNLRVKLQCILSMTLGTIVWMGFHFLIFKSPLTEWKIFHDGIKMAMQLHDGHDLSSLKKYFFEFLQLSRAAILNFWWAYAIFLPAAFYFYLRKLFNPRAFSAVILIVFLAMTTQAYYNDLLIGGMWQTINLSSFYLGWIFLLLIVFFISAFCQFHSLFLLTRKEYIIFFVLFCLPFTGAVGTANFIYLNILFNLAPWFLLIVLLLLKMGNLLQNRHIMQLGVLIIGFSSFIQITSGILLHPYNVYTRLPQQNVSCQIGVPNTRLKIDAPLCNFITQFRQVAQNCGFKPGQSILAFYNMPGLVFALGGHSPIAPWYSKKLIQTPVFMQNALNNPDFKKAFIVIAFADAELPKNLNTLGIRLTDYQSCGRVDTPANYPAPFGNVPAELFKPKT